MFPLAMVTAFLAATASLLFQVSSPATPYAPAQYDHAPAEARGEAMGANMAQFGIGMVSMLQTIRRTDPARMTAIMAAAGANPWILAITPDVNNASANIVTNNLGATALAAGEADNFLPRAYTALASWQIAIYPDAAGQPSVAILFANPAAPELARIPSSSIAYGLQASKQLSAAAGINNNGTLRTTGYVMDVPINIAIDNIPADVPDGAPMWIQCFSANHVVCQ